MSAPVPPHSLAAARIGFGAVMAWDAWRYLDLGYIRDYYIEPDLLFTWWGLEWVRHHDAGIYLHIAIMGIAALGVMLGWFYRASAVTLWLGLTYLTLLDKTRNLNYLYLATILALLFVLVPANAKWSVDARRKPSIRAELVPGWAVWLLRFQVGVPYFFAGVAKLNFDWLIRNEPLREWLLQRTDTPIIGHLFANDITVRAMATGSAILDLTVPFFLLHRKTRAYAYGFAVAFHLLNSRLFSIGAFEWMMIVATTVFFDPDWPRRMVATMRHGSRAARRTISTAAVLGLMIGAVLPDAQWSPLMAAVTAFAFSVLAFHLMPDRLRPPAEVAAAPDAAPGGARTRGFAIAPALRTFLVVWAVLQLLVPLRHFLIPGNVNWTDEGHRFSWHMLLREKSGLLTFHVTDPESGDTWIEEPTQHLIQDQVVSMTGRPDLIVQFAHHLDRYYADLGLRDVEVRVESNVWLNSRRPQVFIDPDVDLTEVSRPLIPPASWIVPLDPYAD